MGWFWGASSSSGSGKDPDDPYKNLDPALRSFLEKESPVRYQTSTPKTSSSKPASLPSSSEKPTPSSTFYDQLSPSSPNQAPSPSEHPTSTDGPPTPAPPSLFPDGRYAHLWKTYAPLSSIESESKSSQEKLLDVLEGYKQRKASIGRAALENCAFEQSAVNDCFSGKKGWKARITMCRGENRELERCYLMQSKFLKALGYLNGTGGAGEEMDERIQMHADTLYQRMLAQEKAIEEAREKGLPEPVFEAVIPPSLVSSDGLPAQAHGSDQASARQQDTTASQTSADESPSASFPPLKRPLDTFPPRERELEERAIAAEISAGNQLVGQIGDVYKEQERERQERKEQGRQTFGDRVSAWFGPK